MINPYVFRRIGALVMMGFVPALFWMIGITFFGFVYAIGFFILAVLVCFIFSTLLLKNPFTSMLEGKGILCFDFNSTGVIVPFLVSVQPPFVEGFLGKMRVKDIFNRSAVHMLATPEPAKSKLVIEDNKYKFELDHETYNKARFALYHYPVLIYNRTLKTFLTKDYLSTAEKDAFAEHQALHLNLVLEDLSTKIRDFGRYIVELTRPQEGKGFVGSIWFYILIGLGLILMAVLLGPTVISTLKGSAASLGASAGSAIPSAPVTPR